VQVSSDREAVRAWTDEARVLRLHGLAPGSRTVEVGRDREHLVTLVVAVPDAGVVRASAALP
jgi:hypothetical protein